MYFAFKIVSNIASSFGSQFILSSKMIKAKGGIQRINSSVCWSSLSIIYLLSSEGTFKKKTWPLHGNKLCIFPRRSFTLLLWDGVYSCKVVSQCCFCWYWWNCWPSLFKLFHNVLEVSILLLCEDFFIGFWNYFDHVVLFVFHNY